MACVDKFTVDTTLDNEFILTIKQTGTTLPMVITGTDTFSAQLEALDGTQVVPITTTVTDMTNGKITLTIPLATAQTLTSKKGEEVDRYYTKPTYKLVIDCDTANNGKFIAKIDYVYVD